MSRAARGEGGLRVSRVLLTREQSRGFPGGRTLLCVGDMKLEAITFGKSHAFGDTDARAEGERAQAQLSDVVESEGDDGQGMKLWG